MLALSWRDLPRWRKTYGIGLAAAEVSAVVGGQSAVPHVHTTELAHLHNAAVAVAAAAGRGKHTLSTIRCAARVEAEIMDSMSAS